MAKSIDKARLIQEARKTRYRNKGDRPDSLNDEQFNAVLFKFYEAAKERGLYTDIQEAIDNKGFYFLGPQREIAECILASVFRRERRYIYISISRQVGKTDIVVFTLSFCYDHYSSIFGDALRMAVVAPEKGTASEVFDRLHDYIIINETELATDTKTRVETLAGDTVAMYGIYEGGTTGSTIEGRTHDVIVRDEGHLGSDARFQDEVIPTASRTRGPIIIIGNGGWRDCFFMRGIKRGTIESEGTYVFRYNYETLAPYMRALAEKGITTAGTWLKNTDAYVRACGGWKSISVRKNVLCEWILEIGTFVTKEDLDACTSTSGSEVTKDDIYISIDVAVKGQDRTIVTFGNKHMETFDYLILKDVGENVAMREQCEVLANYCEEMKYMKNLRAIGVDATGLGIGMAEFLDMTFEVPIKRFTFSQTAKMEWYLNLRDSIITDMRDDRMSFDKTHELYEILEKELLDIEVEVTRNGNLSFHAPTSAVMGKSVNDDFVASIAIYRTLVGLGEGFFSHVKGVSDRLPKEMEDTSIADALRAASANRSAYRAGPWVSSNPLGPTPLLAELRRKRIAKKGVSSSRRGLPFSA